MKFEFGMIGEKNSAGVKAAFEALGLSSFALCEVPRAGLEAFLREAEFRGVFLAPVFRQAAMPYCARLSSRAQKLGGINLILRGGDGALVGENTEWEGFLSLIDRLGVDCSGKQALILGGGYPGRLAESAALERGAKTQRIAEPLPRDFQAASDAQILINATALGAFPASSSSPADLSGFPRCEGVIDLVTRPLRTRLLQQAAARRIPFCGGLWMQAAAIAGAAELFGAQKIPGPKIGEIYGLLQKKQRNILLIGMPGCGKTGLGKKVARYTGRPFYDIDALIEKRAGKTIPEIFAEDDEGTFRALEEEIVEEYCSRSGAVIATSGGAILREENRRNLRQNSFVVFVDRDGGLLATRGRPLSSSKAAIAKMQQQRRPLYLKCSDAVVKNNGSFLSAADRILAAAEKTFDC